KQQKIMTAPVKTTEKTISMRYHFPYPMQRLNWLTLALRCSLLFGLLVPATACEEATTTAQNTNTNEQVTASDTGKPNFVIIFIDDEGIGDVGAYGATGFATPNIDRLAAEGMRFTNYYTASAVCSPSRAGLLTGCYPQRVSIPRVLFPMARHGLNEAETTLGELVREKGYKTSLIGKWHLGHQERFLPLQHGFDEFFGLPYSNDMWPVGFDGKPISTAEPSTAAADSPFGNETTYPKWKVECRPLPLIDGNDAVEEITTLAQQDELTTRYTERAVDFINRNADNPFLLYIPHTMAHVPLAVSKRFRGKSEQGLYGDVMMELDWSVGQITAALEENGLTENTVVLFTTDNGPWLSYGTHGGSNGGYREGKISIFEGGFRVPGIIKWPAVIPAGTVRNQVVSSIDVFPTVADIIGAELPELPIDGVSLLPLLSGESTAAVRETFYYYDLENLNAIRHGDWKYVFPHDFLTTTGMKPGEDGFPGPVRPVQFQGGLFNLRQDPGERDNLAKHFPEKVAELQALADGMRRRLGDKKRGVVGQEIRPPALLPAPNVSSSK
ncbi:MAG: sulfatase, partial [Bacteroidota bacterium]